MKAMNIDRFKELLEPHMPIKSIGISNEVDPYIHYDLGCITILAARLAKDYLDRDGEENPGVLAFTVTDDLKLRSHGRASSRNNLEELIQENEEGAIAYIVMILAPRIVRHANYDGTDDEVSELLSRCDSVEEVRVATEVEGLEFGFSAIVTVGTKEIVWSVAIVNTDEIETVAFSDYDGDCPIAVHMHSLDDGNFEADFARLFRFNKAIPPSEWKATRYGKAQPQLKSEGADFAGPEGVKLIETLMKRDGHDKWQIAYTCLRKLAQGGKNTKVPEKHRLKLIALFKGRIADLEAMVAEPTKTPTHTSPRTIQ